MKIRDVLSSVKYSTDKSVGELDFNKISYKREKIEKDSVYFHLNSKKYNIREIFEDPEQTKPVAIISDGDEGEEVYGIPYIKTENPREALSHAYSAFCKIDYSKLKFIGITGTNGKTTTAHLINEILKSQGKRTGVIGTGKIEICEEAVTSFDYSMTTPDPDVLFPSIKKMQECGCEYVIMEVSSHALSFDKVSPITFDVCIFTNLSHEHLDFHLTMEEYYKSKMKLFDRCKLGIFNVDDEFGRRAYTEALCKKESVGILWDADAVAKEPKLLGFSGSSYLYREKDFIFKMNLPLVGAHNIYNSLCAIKAAVALELRPCDAKHALEKVSSPEGRFYVIRDSVTVIIDYAHTPKAMEITLKTANMLKNFGQKLICVFGCGGERDKSKRPIMGEIAEKISDFVILTEDNSRSEDALNIINEIAAGISDKSKTAIIPKRTDAIENAILNASEGTVIAILGKGAEKYNIDSKGIQVYSDEDVVRKALLKRKEFSGRYEG